MQVGYMKINELIRKGDLDAAQTELTPVLHAEPDNYLAQYLAGLVALRKADFDTALESFGKTVQLKPTHFDAHYCFGLALKEKGQFEDAIRKFRDALRIKPNHRRAIEAIELLGEVYIPEDRLERTIDLPTAEQLPDYEQRVHAKAQVDWWTEHWYRYPFAYRWFGLVLTLAFVCVWLFFAVSIVKNF